MLDWEDQEITNVIWGESRKSDDHIVPYPDGNEENDSGGFGHQTRKGWNEEASSLESDEQKKSTSGAYSLGPKENGSPKYEADESLEESLRLESWADTSISNTIKTDPDSTRIESSNNLAGIPEHDASRQGEISCQNVSSEIFQNQQNDEQDGSFVNYGWDNIGSFDDLERIFSNDDPIFGQASLSNVDELWSPSNDITNSPEKSIPLSFEAPGLEVGALPTLSGELELSSGCSLDQDPLPPMSTKRTNTTSETPNFFQACSNAIEYSEGKNKPLKTDDTTKEASRKTPALNSSHSYEVPNLQNEFVDKGVQQKQILRTGVRSKEKYEVRQLQDICSTWSASANQLQQFDGQYAPAMGQPYPPSVITQNRQLIGPQSSQYNSFPSPFFNSPLYVNMGTQYPPMVGLPQHYYGEGIHQKEISCYGASPVNADALRKPSEPLPMTPQEKIEKLRRRQQMRAMLAIQKQQEKFNNQASSAETSTLDGANSEIDVTMAMIPSSNHLEKDGSTIGVPPDDHPIEDSILFHLQDIVGKLDIPIRLCIRDSLFRLAQSAVQRQYPSDTSSAIRSGRDEGFSKREQNSQNRFPDMPDVETATNPIDRTVAHLLFHRPLESSDKHAKRPDSSCANLSCERKDDLMSLPITQLPSNLGNEVNVSHDGANASHMFTEADHLGKSPGLDVPEISSAGVATAGAAFRGGSSQ